jgi:hypothetical protein
LDGDLVLDILVLHQLEGRLVKAELAEDLRDGIFEVSGDLVLKI